MIRGPRKNWHFLVVAIAAPIAIVSLERAVSHLLFIYAIRMAPKSKNLEDPNDE